MTVAGAVRRAQHAENRGIGLWRLASQCRRGLSALLLFVCFASSSLFAQADRDLIRRKTTDTETAKQVHVPRGYAVVIGISRYKNLAEKNNLQFAETDADAVYRVLISKEGGAFAGEDVHRLTGSQATLANIRREIEEWLPSVAQPEDRVVVYFAGHGLVYRGKGYLAAWDIELNNIGETTYPMRSLGNTLANRVKAKWKALFTDACHSGKINAETTNEEVASQLDSSMDGGQFLSFVATIGKESSYEDPGLSTGFGLFSYFLVQALQGNADNDPCDGWVRAGEVVEYVRTQVRLYAKTLFVEQTPHVGSDYDPAMVLAKSNRCGTGPQPPPTGTAIIDVNLDEVNIWIDDNLIGRASRAKPLSQPGLAEGEHRVCGRKPGYQPACKQILIAPEQKIGVTIGLRYQQSIKPLALELGQKGQKLLYTQRSTINPVNIAPIPRAQSKSDLQQARELFTRALKEDTNYSQAAYELGITNQLLSDEAGSMAAFRRAIDIDRGHVPARVQYAGVLIENGDADEAIRELTEALRFGDANDEAHSLLARAYLDKEVWGRCVESAEKALALNPSNATAHLWRADCLRHIAASEKSVEGFLAAGESYRTFLSLTNYSTPIHEWFAYHFIGFHLGGRSHADRRGSYESMRKSGYIGLCICEGKAGNPLRAREYCRRAIRYDPKDAIAYLELGIAHLGVFEKTEACEDVASARASFVKMLSINSKLSEAKHARYYIDEIDGKRLGLRRRGC